jgi:RNA polymerase sigma-70 factor (ECF subfamily)
MANSSEAKRTGPDNPDLLPSDPIPDGERDELEALSDEELVVRYREGSEYSFQVLMERYRNRLLNWLTRKIGDRSEAEDLVQRTFLRVFRHVHRFDPQKKFSTWLYTIAGNLAKNVFRNRSRDPIVLYQTLAGSRDDEGRQLQWEDTSFLPDEMAWRRDLKDLVDLVAGELPEHYRDIFLLRERQGKSYEEIADITGLKLGTVKSRLSRARRAFAERISERLDEPVSA